MPSIGELVIILVLTVAIGVATRYFRRPGAGPGGTRGGDSPPSDRSSQRDKGRKLKRDTDTGVYVPESDDAGDGRG